ncbi:MAG: 30S ribosomal protein S3 [Oscillospiraceae bacterium]|nr:30S ribosomal protein S3 [Oscillospiraceae bacterium]
MGQKVNPHGLRVGVIKDWDSRWYVRDEDFAMTLEEDHKIRKYLKKALFDAGIPKIEIERAGNRVRVHIHCARPGIVIGKGGTEIERTRKACEDIINKKRKEKLVVYVNVVEVKQVDKNAQLVSEGIASQLENRVSFRRAMKQAIGRAMRFGARGIKVQVSGRLGGAEIARTEHYHEGTIPLQTLRADIDYGFAEANTTYGKIGVKVWIYAGEVLGDARNSTTPMPEERRPRRDDRRDGRPPRRDGGRPGGPGGPGGQRRSFPPREGGSR